MFIEVCAQIQLGSLWHIEIIINPIMAISQGAAFYGYL